MAGRMLGRRVWVAVLSLMVLSTPSLRGDMYQTTVENPDEGPVTSHFGSSIATDGDRLIVGGPSPNFDNKYGTAMIYRRSGDDWVIEHQSFGTGTTPRLREYGASVAIKGEWAFVGSTGQTNSSAEPGLGGVKVLRLVDGEWTETAILQSLVEDDNFGSSIGFDGRTLVVGAPDESSGPPWAGNVYVYTLVGEEWMLQTRLPSPDDYYFGYAVGVTGDRLVASAIGGFPTGTVYTYVREGSGWTNDGAFQGTGTIFGADYGAAICMDGDTFAVTSPDEAAVDVYRLSDGGWTLDGRAKPPTTSTRSARSALLRGDMLIMGGDGSRPNGESFFVFKREASGWMMQERILSPEYFRGFEFGESLALSGDELLVGAPGAFLPVPVAGPLVFGPSWGSIYTYDLDSLELMGTINTADAAENDQFGSALDFSGDNIIARSELRFYTPPNSSNVEWVSLNFMRRFGGMWVRELELFDPLSKRFDNASFAIEGDTAVIGCPADPEAGGVAGAALVYTRESGAWRLDRKLLPPAGTPIRFGTTVDIAGDLLAVSAPGGAVTGVVHLYRVQGGSLTPEASIRSLADEADDFGRWVALHGDVVAVTAQNAVLVYHRNGTTWEKKAEWPLTSRPTGIRLSDVALIVTDERGAYTSFPSGDGWLPLTPFFWNGPILSPIRDLEGDVAYFLGGSSIKVFKLMDRSPTWRQVEEISVGSTPGGVRADGDRIAWTLPLADASEPNSGLITIRHNEPFPPAGRAVADDTTFAGGLVHGRYVLSPGTGTAVPFAELYVKGPRGSWENHGPVGDGQFSFTPSHGDGAYEVSIVGRDDLGRAEPSPTESEMGEVTILWNDQVNSGFGYPMIGEGTYLFPATDSQDVRITFAAASTGGPVDVQRTMTGADYSPAPALFGSLLADEFITVTAMGFTGVATITWPLDAASADSVEGGMPTLSEVYRVDGASVSKVENALITDGVVMIEGATAFGEYFVGATLEMGTGWELY